MRHMSAASLPAKHAEGRILELDVGGVAGGHRFGVAVLERFVEAFDQVGVGVGHVLFFACRASCAWRRGILIRVGLSALPLCGAAVTFFDQQRK